MPKGKGWNRQDIYHVWGTKNFKNNLVGKTCWRSSERLDDNIKMDLREKRCKKVNCNQLAQNPEISFVNTVMNLKVTQMQ
jgi:hypothetical protein